MYTLITGVSRGIGQGVARALGSDRRPLLVTARKAAAALALAREIGNGTKGYGLDVSDRVQIESFARAIRDTSMRISCVVHNAAIYERPGTVDTPEITIVTNVYGPIRLTEALMPVLTPDARIVLVSSSMGLLNGYSPAISERLKNARTREEVESVARLYLSVTAGAADTTKSADAAERAGFNRDPYCVSKAILNALAQGYAAEMPERLIVAVSPGWVQTDMGGAGAPKSLDHGVGRIVMATHAALRSGAFYADGDPFTT